MPEFELTLTLGQFLLPPVCTGILIIGTIFFLYIYLRTRETLYIAVFFLGFFGIIFVGSETLILIFGGWFHLYEPGMEFHRIEQLGGTFFLAVLPYIMAYLLHLGDKWKRVNLILSVIGIFVTMVILLCAFIRPDSFISMKHHNARWLVSEAYYGRGAEGCLITVRDILLGIFIVYGIILTIFDLARHRDFRSMGPVLIGIFFAFYAAIVDIIYQYGDIMLDPFQGIHFSRFTAGITVAIVCIMVSVIMQFIDRTKEVTIAFRALNSTNERFRQISETISEVFWLIDTRQNKLLHINPAVEKIWKIPRTALYIYPETWLSSIHREDYEKVKTLLENPDIKNGEEIEYRIACKDGSTRWIRENYFPLRDENGAIYRLVKLSADITGRKKAEENLAFLAYHDSLTSLPNRKSFYIDLERTLALAKRSQKENIRGLLFLDLDHFKLVNDTMGHTTGDELLIRVAGRITNCLRESDSIYRLGSDEFTIILTFLTNYTDAALVAQKIRHVLEEPLLIAGQQIIVTVSIGISLFPKDGLDMETLIKNADIALLEAKKTKDTYHFFTEAMQKKAVHRMQTITNLRNALKKPESFLLHYQPLVDKNGSIICVEALVRWMLDGTIVYPLDFIPLAEETGLILPLGELILEAACKQQKNWIQDGIQKVSLAINISPKQFRQKGIIDIINRIIDTAGISYKDIDLEITESCIMEDRENAIQKIIALVQKGTRFSIDDFGTGYSSLSTLQKFPLAYLKIDKSFIEEIPANTYHVNLVRTIITLAHNLGLKTIAEGVETENQSDFLRDLGCDIFQGYYFGRPVPADEMTSLLKHKRL
ncbi:MAG: EAL domain-containing protein [Spirochaetales bacterium]|nr:EAL domain-containing protein [Spirochaetales bacterium]